MRRHFGLKILLAGVSALITLIVFEVGIRIFKPQITFSNITVFYPFGCFKKGDYYWIDLMANKQCTLSAANSAFEPHRVDINSLGLRNREVVIPKPSTTSRVLFVGDSFFFGLGVEEKDGVVRKTEELYNKSSPNRIETVNAGLPSAGPSYYYMYLNKEGLRIDPDVVVVGFYFRNDIAENMLNSRWIETNSEGLPEKVESNIYSVDESTGNLFPYELPLKFRVPLLRYSHLFVLAADRLDPPFGDAPKFIGYQLCFYKRSCHDLDEAKEKTKRVFSAIKTLADTRRKKLLVVLVPSELQFSSSVDFSKTDIPVPLSPQEKNYPYQEFGGFFDQNGIDYLDLREHFKKTGQPLEAYFSADRHWNVYGNQLAAEAIGEKLRAMLSP